MANRQRTPTVGGLRTWSRAAAFALATLSAVRPSAAQSTDYLCYGSLKSSRAPAQAKFTPIEIRARDQFQPGGRNYAASKHVRICNPTTGSPTPSIHLVELALKDSRTDPNPTRFVSPATTYFLSDRFVTNRQVRVVKPRSLRVRASQDDYGPVVACRSDSACSDGDSCQAGRCLPADTTPPAPPPNVVDNYVCYSVKPRTRASLPLDVPATDEFANHGDYDLGKLTRLCAPADENGENPGAENHTGHLACYSVKPVEGATRFRARQVAVNIAGAGARHLDLKKPVELCVPAIKTTAPFTGPTSFSLTTGPIGALAATTAAASVGAPRVAPDLVPFGVGCGFISPGPAPRRLLGDPSSMLSCGGINLGGGTSPVAEAATPDGGSNRFQLGACAGSICSIVGASSSGLNLGEHCSQAGCPFGLPQELTYPAQICVHASFAADASGAVDLANGALSLPLDLLWDVHPSACATCSATGTPQSPGIGQCLDGANAGGPCTSTSSAGLSHDCPPAAGGNAACVAAGLPFPCCTGPGTGSCAPATIPVTLPLTTGPAIASDGAGNFCGGQSGAGTSGCFGAAGTGCTSIIDSGAPAGPLAVNVPAGVDLASVFCLPPSTATWNAVLGLPGPGAMRETYSITLQP